MKTVKFNVDKMDLDKIFRLACKNNLFEIANACIKNGLVIDDRYGLLFSGLCTNGQVEIVKALLENGYTFYTSEKYFNLEVMDDWYIRNILLMLWRSGVHRKLKEHKEIYSLLKTYAKIDPVYSAKKELHQIETPFSIAKDKLVINYKPDMINPSITVQSDDLENPNPVVWSMSDCPDEILLILGKEAENLNNSTAVYLNETIPSN